MSQPQDTTPSTQSPSMAQESNSQRPEAPYHSYHAQVQNLKQLPVPYSDLYRALASYETMELPPLSANFRKMAADLSLWLETAEKAVFSLEMDIQQDGASGRQDVSELDLIMSRFHPNIDMLRELKEKIKSRLQTTTTANSGTGASPEEAQLVDKDTAQDALISEQELEGTASTIQSSWSTLISMMGRVKGVLASVRVRGDLLTQMEVVLAEVEEIGLEIDSFREELARQALDADASKASQSISSPPYLLPSATAESMATSADEIKAKQPDTETLTLLDSRIESLGSTIDALTVRIDSLPLDAPKRGELREHYAQLLRLWDDGKARREKINVEMKERRWLAVFEQVAGQVESMMESVDRAVVHCKGLIDQIKVMVKDKVIPTAPIDREHLYTIFKSFEAKHKYYAPAINKMLNMLENGIESRMTRDPDVIEKHRNMKERWDHLRGGLDQVELDMSSIEKMLDILDGSIPSYASTPPAQLPEKPLFAMRRSQTQTGWQPSGPPSLFQPPDQSSPQIQRGRRPQPSSSGLQTPDDSPVSTYKYTGSSPAMVAFAFSQQSPKHAVPKHVQQLSIAQSQLITVALAADFGQASSVVSEHYNIISIHPRDSTCTLSSGNIHLTITFLGRSSPRIKPISCSINRCGHGFDKDKERIVCALTQSIAFTTAAYIFTGWKPKQIVNGRPRTKINLTSTAGYLASTSSHISSTYDYE
ncbi:hypothetical protein BGZ72_005601 [Mortierella alpina]|nr:hypothetical protein BGZ72_005601 [Mortierella alpina]